MYSLRSGIPCLNHSCVLCCKDTEMTLSHTDIKKIMSMGFKLRDFACQNGKEWQLKNRFGRCVFLSMHKCTIYPIRPEGCQLYPLVYHDTMRKGVIDHLCPYGNEFKITKTDLKMLRCLLMRI